MSNNRRGLGRGVQDLGLGDLLSDIHQSETKASEQQSLQELAIDKIQPSPYQPRKHFDENALNELAESIRQQGILQPLVVRPKADRFELIAGERRWRAAQLARIETVPAVVKSLDEQSTAAIIIIENLQREDLRPLEQAQALDRLKNEFGMQHQAIADAVGMSRVAVTNYLRLLQLTQPVKQMLEDKQLEMGHCRALLSLDAYEQLQVAQQVVDKHLSVRQTEEWIQNRQKRPGQSKTDDKQSQDPDIAALQDRLAQKLGAEVKVQQSSQGRGKLVIHYHSLDELDGILSHIQ